MILMGSVLVTCSKTGTRSEVDKCIPVSDTSILWFLDLFNLPSFCLMTWFHLPNKEEPQMVIIDSSNRNIIFPSQRKASSSKDPTVPGEHMLLAKMLQ